MYGWKICSIFEELKTDTTRLAHFGNNFRQSNRMWAMSHAERSLWNV